MHGPNTVREHEYRYCMFDVHAYVHTCIYAHARMYVCMCPGYIYMSNDICMYDV